MGFEFLSENIGSSMQKDSLKNFVNKFNELGAEYQDEWDDEYWSVYELIREGYKTVKFK